MTEERQRKINWPWAVKYIFPLLIILATAIVFVISTARVESERASELVRVRCAERIEVFAGNTLEDIQDIKDITKQIGTNVSEIKKTQAVVQTDVGWLKKQVEDNRKLTLEHAGDAKTPPVNIARRMFGIVPPPYGAKGKDK